MHRVLLQLRLVVRLLRAGGRMHKIHQTNAAMWWASLDGQEWRLMRVRHFAPRVIEEWIPVDKLDDAESSQ